MFRDFKSNEFSLESTWSTDIYYAKILYFCVCIAYSYIISLGTSCTKDKKNKLLSATKNIKGKKVRIYSLFTTGYNPKINSIIIENKNYYGIY